MVPQPTPRWTWTPDDGRRVRSVSLRGEVLVVTHGGGRLTGLDAAEGRVLWSQSPGAVCEPGGTEDVVAVLDADSCLHGFRVRDGSSLWQRPRVIGRGRPAQGPGESVAVSVGTAAPGHELFTVTRTWTRIYDGFDAYDGKQQRQEAAVLDAAGNVVRRASDVGWYDDSWTRPWPEYANGPRWITARDPATGAVRWRSRTWRGAGQARICVDVGARAVLGISGAGLRAFEDRNGRLMWKRPAVRSRPGVAVPHLVQGAAATTGVLCVAVSGSLAAFSAATGEALWRRDLPESLGALTAMEGVVYAQDRSDGPLRAFSAADGKELWRCPAGPDDARRVRLVGVRDGLHVVQEAGSVHAFHAFRAMPATVSPGPTSARAHLPVAQAVPGLSDRFRDAVEGLRRPRLRALEREHRVHGPTDGAFHPTTLRRRTVAVAQYGAAFYDGGIKVYLAVDLRTGAFEHWHENGVEGRSLPPLALAALVPVWDPVRRWLTTGPDAGTVIVRIRSRGQLRRFSAAAIVRADRPELAPPARPKASPLLALTNPRSHRLVRTEPAADLPYRVLFGHQTTAPTRIGRHGEHRMTTREQETG